MGVITRSGLWTLKSEEDVIGQDFLNILAINVFRKNHSTTNALIQLYDKLLYATDKGKVKHYKCLILSTFYYSLRKSATEIISKISNVCLLLSTAY